MMVGACALIVQLTMTQLEEIRPFDARAQKRSTLTAPDDSLLKRFPSPQLQIAPPVERLLVEREEDEILSTYGWVDRQSGIVRIPIDRAISLLAQGHETRDPSSASADDKTSSIELLRERAKPRD